MLGLAAGASVAETRRGIDASRHDAAADTRAPPPPTSASPADTLRAYKATSCGAQETTVTLAPAPGAPRAHALADATNAAGPPSNPFMRVKPEPSVERAGSAAPPPPAAPKAPPPRPSCPFPSPAPAPGRRPSLRGMAPLPELRSPPPGLAPAPAAELPAAVRALAAAALGVAAESRPAGRVARPPAAAPVVAPQPAPPAAPRPAPPAADDLPLAARVAAARTFEPAAEPSSRKRAASPPVPPAGKRPAPPPSGAASFVGVAKPARGDRGKATALRQNFVRTHLRGAGAKKKFAASRHSAAPPSRGRSRRAQPPTLPAAGVGADLAVADGAPARARCWRCHGSGHYAASCGGLLDNGEKAPAPDGAPKGPEALPPPPAPLPADAPAADVEATVSAAYGFAGFRGRQAEVIARVLAGRSTLAILPTGAGKSLCYAAPALVGAGTVLVITPLLALARDQMAHLPPHLPAGMLASDVPPAQARATLSALASGNLRVLFVAPERLASPALAAALAPNLPLPLVCVDEAHCVDEWGHNFRTAYFRLGRLLPPSRCVLALTATATRATQAAVAAALRIDPVGGVVRDASLRSNLRLAASRVTGGVGGPASRRAVVALFARGGRLERCARAIIYVPYQASADTIAAALVSAKVKAAAYHAGLAPRARAAAAAALAAGRVRAVVATVAFGMGVDIPGVDAVVHAGLPRSVEEYVQQVGRGGRGAGGAWGGGAGDGGAAAARETALCHALVDDGDYRRLRSLSHADGASAAGVGRLLDAVFSGAPPGVGGGRGAGGVLPSPAPTEEAPDACVYRVLPLTPLTVLADARLEAVETLLAYAEADGGARLSLLPRAGATFKVAFFKTAPALLAAECPVVAAVLALCKKGGVSGAYAGRTDAVATAAQRSPADTLAALSRLAAAGEAALEVDPAPSACLRLDGPPPTGAPRAALAARLAARHAAVSQGGAARLDAAYRVLAAASDALTQEEGESRLRAAVDAYFDGGVDGGAADADTLSPSPSSLPLQPSHPALVGDVRWLLAQARARKGPPMGARAAARVLHGVSSPAFPAAGWADCGVWGRYAHVDFGAVVAAGEAAVVAATGGGGGDEVGGGGGAPASGRGGGRGAPSGGWPAGETAGWSSRMAMQRGRGRRGRGRGRGY